MSNGVGGQALTALVAIAIGAMSAAILIINNEKLASTGRVCYQWSIWWQQCQTWIWGCLWTDDSDNSQPCSYCYSVGAISIFAQLIALCFSWTAAAWPLNVVVSGFNIVWFAVAGDYFTKKFKDHRMLPEDGSRHAIMGLMWACLALAGVQFIFSIVMVTRGRKGRPEDYKERPEGQQPYEMGAAPPAPGVHVVAPPPPGYPAGGYAAPPPPGSYPQYGAPPPPGGYPYGAPPPPGGYPAAGYAPPPPGGAYGYPVAPPPPVQ